MLKMQVMNFCSSYIPLGFLNRNFAEVNKSGAKLASGVKITGAKDDSSAYQISENMRVRLRGLEQARKNTENGNSLLAIAEGGLQQITELIKGMRELSLKASNGIYTDADMHAMDEEYQQRVKHIDDIVASTNYNGIPLLDGSLALHGGGRSPGFSMPESQMYSPAAPTGVAAASLAAATYTITGDGVFVIPAGFSGDILVKSSNVLIKQASAAALTNVSIQCDPGTNLFLEDLNLQTINNTAAAGKSAIEFKGAGNTLNLKGNNTVRGYYGFNDVSGLFCASLIHVGAGTDLTIRADKSGGSLNMDKSYGMTNSYDQGGAVLGGNSAESAGRITINSGNLKIKNAKFSNGAAIGGGASRGNGGTITINGGTIEASAEDGAAIGGGGGGSGGVITINGGDVTARIDGGYSNDGAAIGGGMNGASGVITLAGGKIRAITTKGPDSYTGSVSQPIGRGNQNTSAPNLRVQNGKYTVTGNANEQIGVYDFVGPGAWPGWGGLLLETGTRSYQALRCSIRDMRSSALGLDGGHLQTRDAAKALLDGSLDAALNQVLKETTWIGAYQMRLTQTAATLTIDAEHTAQSESAIRDADMAKEMTNHTKSKVLAQSAQAMLAQANQRQESLLALLN